MAFIGYARVSTTGQDYQTQVDKLLAAGCDADDIYTEKQSGKSANDREQLQKALDYVRKGDVFIITKLDRLARSTIDLCTIVKQLEEKHVAFRVLDQGGMDTTKPEGKLMFNIMASIAEFERDMINARTKEGRTAAKARGVKFGRKPKLDDAGKQAVLSDIAAGELSMQAIADKHGIGRKTAYRIKAEDVEKAA